MQPDHVTKSLEAVLSLLHCAIGMAPLYIVILNDTIMIQFILAII